MAPEKLKAVVRDPPGDLLVDATPLYIPGFNTSSICNTDHVYPSNTPEDYCRAFKDGPIVLTPRSVGLRVPFGTYPRALDPSYMYE
ncbi:hypothetical protein BJX64DRAFT_288935 [Aspergillus heterothallicus]